MGRADKSGRLLGILIIISIIGFIYLRYQSYSIYGGDAGDLASAVLSKGIPHPPGYPLQTLLGIDLVSLIPYGTVAWRIGFISSVSAILTFIFLFELIFSLIGKFIPSLISVLVFAFTYPVWLYGTVVEVFSLNNLFTVILLNISFKYHFAPRKKYIFLLMFIMGLALCNHHIILFLIPALLYLTFTGGIYPPNSGLELNQGKKAHMFKSGKSLIDSCLCNRHFLFHVRHPKVADSGMTSIPTKLGFASNLRSQEAPKSCRFRYDEYKFIKKPDMLKSLIYFLFGLSPYLYVFISSVNNPLVNWMGYPSLANFLALVSRSAYGPFVSGAYISHDPLSRLLNIYTFINFAYQDFRPLGLFLFILGGVFAYKKSPPIFRGLIIGFISYLFFIFYASFILTDNFAVATLERFVQPLYIFITIFIAFGMVYLLQIIRFGLGFMMRTASLGPVLYAVCLIFFIYPLSLLWINYPRISILRKDFTAENLGRDIINSVEDNSVIFLIYDHPIFNTQYYYYSQPDHFGIPLIVFSRFMTEEYRQQLSFQFPDLVLPPKNPDAGLFLPDFLTRNVRKRPVYSKLSLPAVSGTWIPWGLLFKYYEKDREPQDKYIYEENNKLWQKYQDPLSGSLGKYPNLMLTNVLWYYGIAHQEIAYWEANHNYISEAEKHLLQAEKLIPQDKDSYNLLSQIYIRSGRCDDAKIQVEKLISVDPSVSAAYKLLSRVYSDCYHDQKKAEFYAKIFSDKQKADEIPLRSF